MPGLEMFCLGQVGITQDGFDEFHQQQVALKRRAEGDLGGEFVVTIT